MGIREGAGEMPSGNLNHEARVASGRDASAIVFRNWVIPIGRFEELAGRVRGLSFRKRVCPAPRFILIGLGRPNYSILIGLGRPK